MLLVYVGALMLTAGLMVSAKIDDITDIQGRDEQVGYDQLNAILVGRIARSKEVDDEYAEANIKVAKEKLKQLKSSSSSKSLVKALRLFIALSSIEGEDKCSSGALNILDQNKQAWVDRLKSTNDKVCYKRVEKILIYFAKKNAKACQSVYPAVLRERLSQVSKKSLDIVEQLANDVLEKYPTEGESEVARLYRLLYNSKQLSLELEDGHLLLNFLDKLVKLNDPAKAEYLRKVDDELVGLMRMKGKEIQSLFSEYIVEPCEKYIEAVGYNVFNPARFLATFQHELMPNELDYYKKWFAYTVCMKIKDRKDVLFWKIHNLAESLSNSD